MANELDVSVLREKALAAGCVGLASLIEFIENERKAGRVIRKIGSGTIDFHGKVSELQARQHTESELGELIFSLPNFHFGRTDGLRTPLQDIADFVDGIDQVPQEKRMRMDEFFADLTIPQAECHRWKVVRGVLIVMQQVQ